MTRIATLATSDQMTAILGRTQQRVQELRHLRSVETRL